MHKYELDFTYDFFPFGWWPHLGFYFYFGPSDYSRAMSLTFGFSILYFKLDWTLWRYNEKA